jgi:hypothetical protein
MAIRYEIRRKLDNGDVLCVAECGDDQKRAEQLAHSLNEIWPGEYEILEVVTDESP